MNETTNKPHFTHDCDECIFLGPLFNGKKNDVYLAIHTTYPTLIVRYGNEGSEYASFPLRLLAENQPTMEECITDLDLAFKTYKDQILKILIEKVQK